MSFLCIVYIFTCANHTQLLRTVFGAIRVNEKGEFKLPYRQFLNGIRNIQETGIRNARGWNPGFSRLESRILKVGIWNTRVIRITLHGASKMFAQAQCYFFPLIRGSKCSAICFLSVANRLKRLQVLCLSFDLRQTDLQYFFM